MALTMAISTAARNAAVDAITALLNAGGAGSIKIYTGAQPAGPGTAATGTLLGTLTLSATSFPAAASGSATANAITSDSSADATGTAGYFRAASGAGTAVIDGSVGTTGADLNLDSVSIVAGGVIAVTSWTITMPAS